MKKLNFLKNIVLLSAITASPLLYSQQPDGFDFKKAYQEAQAKGMQESEIKGYVDFLKNDFNSKQIDQNKTSNKNIGVPTIYLTPSKNTNSSCPNMGFEQYNFVNWVGETGTTTTAGSGASTPNYNTSSVGVANSAGNNVSLVQTLNYHTLMTLPATNAIYPNCAGYDSAACKAAGSTTVSQIPVVSPFSKDPVSVRLNGLLGNSRACKLRYVTTTSSTNNYIAYSCAWVGENAAHLSEESPYFKVTVKNESTGGTILPGCESFTLNAASITPGDSVFPSAIGLDFIYRKWKLYVVDLSSLPLGTNVSVNFEVGSCTLGGHFSYAYVDAECGYNPTSSNMCPGSSFATLTAPSGYLSYQWYDPTNNPISGATSSTVNISSPTVGNVYTAHVTTTGGCSKIFSVTIANSSVTINNISSTGTCPNGNTGSALVNAGGSNGTYSYTWTNMSNNSVVGNGSSVANLPVGNYSVVVSSGTCGQATATVAVPFAPPAYSSELFGFCGNAAVIGKNGGTNYQWYQGSASTATLIPAPEGTNDSLFINNAANGSVYTLVYESGGCKDSIRFTLNQTNGGGVNVTNVNDVCSGNTNGSAQLNLTALNTSPFQYLVTNGSGTILNTTTSSTVQTINSLGAGTYSYTVNDGNCIYKNIFTIGTIPVSFSITPGSTGVCDPNDTATVHFSFGDYVGGTCALGTSSSCLNQSTIQIGNGTQSNSSTAYPAIYSNWYKNARHQLLFTAAELTAAGVQPGKIGSISFNVNNFNSGTTSYPDFTIKMKCTSVNDLSSPGFDNVGLTQVYYTSVASIALGWNTYTFPTPYVWDGVSNLLIDVCSNLTTNYTYNSSSPYTITPFISVRWFNSDATVACMTSNTPASYSPSNTYRPNILLTNCASSSATSYTIAASSNGTVVANYGNDSIKIVPTTPQSSTAQVVYTFTVTNPNGCSSVQDYTVPVGLNAVVSSTNASCGTCPNGAVTVNTDCGNPPFQYVWNPGNYTTQTVNGLLPGCYTVTVTDANNNVVTESTCVTFSTKLDELNVNDAVMIYPNPSSGIFNLYSKNKIENMDIVVINTLGQTVKKLNAKNVTEITIDMSSLSKGIYYLKAATNESSTLFKLIVE